MTKVIELLEAVKAAKNVQTDYALAKVLDLPTQRISDYMKGERAPDEFACLQIAKALGESYEVITALVKMETEKDEGRRNAWREYYKSIGGIAASVLCALAVVVTMVFSFPQNALANQSLAQQDFTSYKLCAYCRRVRTRVLAVWNKLTNAFRYADCLG